MADNCGSPTIFGDGAYAIVASGWDMFSTIANSAVGLAQNQINTLNDFYIEPPFFSVNFETPSGLTAFDTPSEPERPSGLEYSAPTLTAMTVFEDIEDPDFEDFRERKPDAPPTRYSTGHAPGNLSVDAPGDAPEITEITLPEESEYPTYTLDDLFDINMPTEIPVISDIEFLGERPEFDFDPPAGGFAFVEVEYTSALLDQVKTKLGAMITGGTGLPAAIEQALFDRARVREDMLAAKVVQETIEEFSSRGLSEPSGVLAKRVDQVRQVNYDKASSLSRDIEIENKKIEIESLRFAVTQSIALEQILIGVHMQIMQRAFEVNKYILDSAIAIFNARVQQYNATVQLYLADAQVYRDRVQAEIAKVQIYQAQIEAQKTIAQTNQILINAYEAKLRSVAQLVDIYKSRLEAARTTAEIDRIRIEAFRAEVESYSAQVRAYAVQWEGFRSRVEADKLQFESYDIAVRAYATQVTAWAEQEKMKIARRSSDIELRDLDIKVYVTQLEFMKTQIQAEQGRLASLAGIYQSDAEIYRAKGQIESSRTETNNRAYGLAVETERSRTETALKEAEIKITNAINSANLLLRAKETASQATSQLAGASMSAVHLAAQVQSGHQTSEDYGCRTQYTFSGEAA